MSRNDDLISRRALCEYALNQKDKSVSPNDIMRFPSAQPEHCGDAVNDLTEEKFARWRDRIQEAHHEEQ